MVRDRMRRRCDLAPPKVEGTEKFVDYVKSMELPRECLTPPPPPPPPGPGGSRGGPPPKIIPPSPPAGAVGMETISPADLGGGGSGGGGPTAPSAPLSSDMRGSADAGALVLATGGSRGSAGSSATVTAAPPRGSDDPLPAQYGALCLTLPRIGSIKRETSVESQESSVGVGPGRKGDPPPQPPGVMTGSLHSYLDPEGVANALPKGYEDYEVHFEFQRLDKYRPQYLANQTCIPCHPEDDKLFSESSEPLLPWMSRATRRVPKGIR